MNTFQNINLQKSLDNQISDTYVQFNVKFHQIALWYISSATNAIRVSSVSIKLRRFKLTA